MTAGRLYRGALAVFVALSLTDFVQTYALIHAGDGSVYEANPVAAPWLEKYGWDGLAAYKLGAVLVVVAAVAGLARRDRRAAVGVAALGCAAVLSVTLYSRGLIEHGPPPVPRDEDEDMIVSPVPPEYWQRAMPPVSHRGPLPDRPGAAEVPTLAQ